MQAGMYERWHPAEMPLSSPQMADYLSQYGVKLDGKPAKKGGKRKHKLHVLLYGDSIDRVMLEDVCEIGGGVRQQCWVDPKSASPESLPSLLVHSYRRRSRPSTRATSTQAGNHSCYDMFECSANTQTQHVARSRSGDLCRSDFHVHEYFRGGIGRPHQPDALIVSSVQPLQL